MLIVSDCIEDQFHCDDGRYIMNEFLCLLFQIVQKTSFAVMTGGVS